MRIYECWVPIAPEVKRQQIEAKNSLTARRLMAERVGCAVIDVVAVAEIYKRQADHIDGYDRDDLGESPDY